MLVPVLAALPFEMAETLDLSDVDRLSSAPSGVVLRAASSPDIWVGESDRTGASSLPELEDESGSLGRLMVGLAGDEVLEPSTLPMDAERADNAADEGARSLPRRVCTTSCTCRLRGFLDAVGGGLTMM